MENRNTWKVMEHWEQNGSGFYRKLAAAWFHADNWNKALIEDAFGSQIRDAARTLCALHIVE